MNEKLAKVHDIYNKHNHLEVGDRIALTYLPEAYSKKEVQLLRCDCGDWKYAIVEYGQPHPYSFDEHDDLKFLQLAMKQVAKQMHLEKEFHEFIKKNCKLGSQTWNKLVKGDCI